MPNTIIQGVADLDITPFLAKLQSMQQAATASATAIGNTMRTIQGSLGAAGAGMATLGAGTAAGMNQAAAGFGQVQQAAATTAAKVSAANTAIANTANQAMTGQQKMLAMLQKRYPGVDDSYLMLKAIEDKYNSLFRAGSQISQVGMTLGFVGAAVLGLSASAIQAASGFDFWTEKFIAAAQAAGNFLGKGYATREELRQIKDLSQQVSVATGASFDSVAQAMYIYQSAAGVEISSMREVAAVTRDVETVIKAATITSDDQAVAIRNVIQILGAYRLGLESTEHVTRVILNATQVSNAEWKDLSEAIKMSGSAMHTLNVPFEEGVAVLARLADVGQRGTQAGRGVQRMLLGLVDPAKQAQAAMNTVFGEVFGLGETWKSVLFPGGKFIGVIDKVTESGEKQLGMLGVLYKASMRMTDADRARLMATLTTENAFRVLMPLLAAYGEEQAAAAVKTKQSADEIKHINAVVDDFASVQGKADIETRRAAASEITAMTDLFNLLSNRGKQIELFGEQWDTMRKSIKIGWAQAWREIQESITEVGDAASEALLPLLAIVGRVTDGIKAWARANPEAFKSTVAFTVAAGALATVMGLLMFTVGQFVQSFVAVGSILAEGAKYISDLVGGRILLLIRFLGLLLVAVGALSAAWRQNWAGIATPLNTAVQAVRDLLASLLRLVTDTVGVVASLIQGDWAAAWSGLGDIILTVVSFFSLYLRRLVTEIGTVFSNILAIAGAKLMELVVLMQVGGHNMIVSFVTGIISSINSFLVPTLHRVAETIAGFFRGQSPPKEGPLKGITQWGENIMAAYAEGVEKGGIKHLRDAARKAAGELSKPLEGHSPAKEGPLKEVDSWSTGWMDAYLRGLEKADFSVLNDIAGKIVARLKDALADKKIDLGAFVSFSHAAKEALTELLAEVRLLGVVAGGALERAQEIAGSLGGDIGNVISAYARLVGFQKELVAAQANQKALQERLSEEYEKPRQALEREGQILAETRYQWTLKAQAIDDAVKKLERSKYPLEDELRTVRALVDEDKARAEAIDSGTTSYEAQMDALRAVGGMLSSLPAGVGKEALAAFRSEVEALKEPIQAVIDGIREQIEGWQEARDAIADQLEALSEERDLIQEQIDAIEERYKKEEEAAKAEIGKLRDQLDLVKALNEEKMRPLESAAENAGEALEAKRLADKREEASIEQQISIMRSRGVAGFYIDQLEAQLAAMKVQHEQEETLLEDKKNAADDAVDAAKDAADAEEAAIQAGIDAKERAEKAAAEARRKAIDDETAALKLRLAAIDEESKALEKQQKALDKKIAAAEKEIRAREKEEAAIDKRLAAIDKQSKALDQQRAAIEREIAGHEAAAAIVQKKLDAIDREIELTNRNRDAIEDELLIIDREEARLAHERELLELRNLPLKDEIAAADKAVEAMKDRVSAAERLYEIEQAILDLHEADKNEIESAQKSSKSKESGWEGVASELDEPNIAPPKLFDVDAWTAGLEDRLNKMLTPLKTFSSDLEAERARIQKAWDNMWGIFDLSKLFGSKKSVLPRKAGGLLIGDDMDAFLPEPSFLEKAQKALADTLSSVKVPRFGQHAPATSAEPWHTGMAGDAGAGRVPMMSKEEDTAVTLAVSAAALVATPRLLALGRAAVTMASNFRLAFSSAATGVGIFERLGVALGIDKLVEFSRALGLIGQRFALAFGGPGSAMGLNFIQKLGAALGSGSILKFGSGLLDIAKAFGRFNVVGIIATSVIGAFVNNTMGVRDFLFNVLLKGIKEVGDAFGKAGSVIGKALGPIGIELGKLDISGILSTIGNGLSMLSGLFDILGAVILRIVGTAFGVLIDVFTNLITFGGNVIAVVIDIVKFIGSIGAAFMGMGSWGDVFNNLIAIFSDFGRIFVDVFVNIARAFNDLFLNLFGIDLFNVIGNWLTGIGQAWNNFWSNSFIQGFIGAIGNFIGVVVEWFHKIFGSGVIGDWLDSLGAAWDTFWHSGLMGFLVDGLGGIFDFVKDIFGKIKNFLVGEDGSSGLVGSAFGLIGDLLGRDESSGLRGLWTGAWTGISNFLFGPDGKSGLVGGIKTLFVGEDGETGAIGGIKNFIELILGKDDDSGLRGIWKNTFGKISEVLFGPDGKSGLVGTIKNFLVGEDGDGGIIGDARNAIGTMLGKDDSSGLRGIFKTAFDAINKAIDVVTGPLNGFISLCKRVVQWAKDAWAAVSNAPKEPETSGTRHSGGPILKDEIAELQKGEYVLNRATVEKFLGIFGVNWANLINNPAMMAFGPALQTAMAAASPVNVVSTSEIHLHVGTLVADESGLIQLESRLKRLRDLRSSRIAR